jgi:hypothetical protein
MELRHLRNFVCVGERSEDVGEEVWTGALPASFVHQMWQRLSNMSKISLLSDQSQ